MDYPGGGNLIIFNNLHFEEEDNHTAVIEIKPPLDESGNYIISDEMPYGPQNLEWLYAGDIQAPIQGGAFRLSNGNTIITQTHTSKILEVDMAGNEVWEYQFESENGSPWIARAQKYASDYLLQELMGDLNQDGTLNVLDIVLLANLILTGDESNPLGDLNQDGMLNVLDIVLLVNAILGE